MKNAQVLLSENISAFLNCLEQVKKDYDWAVQEEIHMDSLTQDYLHMLEFSELNYRDRANIAKSIKECRMKRRHVKDMMITTEPLMDFLAGDKGKMLVAQLQQVLGKIRKQEKIIGQRTYTPKVLSKDVFDECLPYTEK